MQRFSFSTVYILWDFVLNCTWQKKQDEKFHFKINAKRLLIFPPQKFWGNIILSISLAQFIVNNILNLILFHWISSEYLKLRCGGKWSKICDMKISLCTEPCCFLFHPLYSIFFIPGWIQNLLHQYLVCKDALEAFNNNKIVKAFTVVILLHF